jgi:hypothetical protein
LLEAVHDAEAIVLLTAWPEFQLLPALLDRLRVSPVVIDGRRVLDKRKFARYEGIGLSSAARPSVARAEPAGNSVLLRHEA